ncbi:MAG: hypothetical protein Q8L85_09250 [Alphaproteobacteria bacterium]|nr:hypothetical protein [Alphaproteobacteria bacterium]
MKKRLYFIALLTILSLNFATSPLFAVTTISGDETPTFTSVENSQEEAVHGPQPNPEINNNNNNQIDDENQVDLNGEDQFTEEEKKAFVEFNSKTDRDFIYDLLVRVCAMKSVEGKIYRYKAKKGQESILKSLGNLIENDIQVKLIFSSSNILDNGVVETTYNIMVGENLFEDVLLIDVMYHYPTFSTKKCVFNSKIDDLLTAYDKIYNKNGANHGNYLYFLQNDKDRDMITLLNKNKADFRFNIWTKCPYGAYEHHTYDHNYCNPVNYVTGQLYVDEQKLSRFTNVVAMKK